jgi:hypothetical protein
VTRPRGDVSRIPRSARARRASGAGLACGSTNLEWMRERLEAFQSYARSTTPSIRSDPYSDARRALKDEMTGQMPAPPTAHCANR